MSGCAYRGDVISTRNSGGRSLEIRHCNHKDGPDGCVISTADLLPLIGFAGTACERCPLSAIAIDPNKLKSDRVPQPVLEIKELVGDAMKAILDECGIVEPPSCNCGAWRHQMNQGVEWCEDNREEIVTHLNETASKKTWMDMGRAFVKGYLSTDAMLNEAIKRANK